MTDQGKENERLSDERLLVLVAEKDAPALEELYGRFSKPLFSYLLHMLAGNADKAQDFLQDVFIKVLEKAPAFRPSHKARTWLFTIARNLCLNEYRRLSVQASVYKDDWDSHADKGSWQQPYADSQLDDADFRRALLKSLYRCNPVQRSVFILRFQHELSVKEIAEIMNCAEGTVKSRLHYTAKKLAGELQIFNPNKQEEISDGK